MQVTLLMQLLLTNFLSDWDSTGNWHLYILFRSVFI